MNDFVLKSLINLCNNQFFAKFLSCIMNPKLYLMIMSIKIASRKLSWQSQMLFFTCIRACNLKFSLFHPYDSARKKIYELSSFFSGLAQLQRWLERNTSTKTFFFPFTFTSPMQLPLISSKKNSYTNNKNFSSLRLYEGFGKGLIVLFYSSHSSHPSMQASELKEEAEIMLWGW